MTQAPTRTLHRPFIVLMLILLLLCASAGLCTAVEPQLQQQLPPALQWHGNNQTIVTATGTKRLLVVRVSSSAPDGVCCPKETIDEIRGAVFGTGPDRLDANVVSQFAAVSHGQLRFVPASTGDSITAHNSSTDGVVDVLVNVTLTGEGGAFEPALPEVMAATELALNVTGIIDVVADHIMFCFPNGALPDDSAAIGQLGGRVRCYCCFCWLRFLRLYGRCLFLCCASACWILTRLLHSFCSMNVHWLKHSSPIITRKAARNLPS
jgi:hypothetical protein